jgi:hypothetical protein
VQLAGIDVLSFDGKAFFQNTDTGKVYRRFQQISHMQIIIIGM